MVNKNNLFLRIFTLSGLKYEEKIYSFQVLLPDGLITINQNYSSVIEEVAPGKLKIFKNNKYLFESFLISGGWLLFENNVCELFITKIEKI